MKRKQKKKVKEKVKELLIDLERIIVHHSPRRIPVVAHDTI